MIAVAGELAVSCRHLSFSFGKHLAVDDVDLDVRRGEIFGLLGPNGAGKTTAIRVVTTLRRPSVGSVEVFGHGREARRHARASHDRLRAAGAVGRRDADRSRERHALRAAVRCPAARAPARASAAIEAMGLSDSADRIVKTYSGGMIRRLELAQALVSRPRLLVLDEPTIGLDPIARADLWETIHELREQFGVTVLDDHPLPRGGGCAVRPDRPHAPRAPTRDRQPGRAEAGARTGLDTRRRVPAPRRRRDRGDRRSP